MARIILTADIHLGYPGKLDDIITALSVMRQYAADNDIRSVVIMGDLFHTRQAIATDVMSATYDFFKGISGFNQDWVVFPGNHDMFLKYSWKINPLKVLDQHLTVIEKESIITINDHRFWILPYIHDENVYMKAIDKIGDKCSKGDVFLTHIGVHGATLNECFLHKNWSVVSLADFPLRSYAGHFHCYQQVGNNLWYPGSLIPFRFDEGLVDHGFIVYDQESGDHEFVKIYDLFGESRPPDYPTIPDVDVDNISSKVIVGNNVRVALGRDYTKDELVGLRAKLMEMGAVSVYWQKVKEKDEGLSEKLGGTEISMADPDNLILKWLEHDKPEAIDKQLLLDLNKDVVVVGNERVVENDRD